MSSGVRILGNGYVADAAWHEVGAVGEPAFQNSWANFGSGIATAGFRMDAEGWVHLKGLVRLGSSSTTIFTLPVGYRPRYTQRFGVVANSGVACTVTIFSDGRVVPALMTGATNAYLSLSGIQFIQWSDWADIGQRITYLNNQVNYFNDATSLYPHFISRDNGFDVFNGIGGPSVAGIHHYGAPSHHAQMMPIVGANSFALFQSIRGAMSASAVTTTYFVGGSEMSRSEMADDFTSLAKANSWVDYSTGTNDWGGLRYTKDKYGFVHLQGLVSSGSSATATIGTLPAGFRPAARELFLSVSNGSAARVDIYANGEIKGDAGASTTWISLCGLSFYAEL